MKQPPPEMTVKAVSLGIFLAFVFGSANAYLGMKAGQTVAATIPAAVIAMALFRIPAFRGGILEQNITRTAASVGEALVAGAIFTIPAFMMVDIGGQRLWTDLRSHYWEATLILLVGGLIGVFFIILLRRPLCVDAPLPWPESVASYEIVKAGEASASKAPRYIFGALGFGGLIEILTDEKGAQIFREYRSTAFSNSRAPSSSTSTSRRSPSAMSRISAASPGPRPASRLRSSASATSSGPSCPRINVAGGIIAWWILIPLLLFFDPDLAAPHRNERSGRRRQYAFGSTSCGRSRWAPCWWARPTPCSPCASRYGVRCAGSLPLRPPRRTKPRRSIPPSAISRRAGWCFCTAVLLIPITAIYYYFTHGIVSAIVAAVIMTVTGFLLSAIGGYLVGLVGSSNQPLSGLTLAALIIAALVMLTIGVTGLSGVAAVLGVAAVVCVACSVSGSLIQDLKAGHLLGGTPWKMEVVEIISVILLAFFLMGPIIALHEANLDYRRHRRPGIACAASGLDGATGQRNRGRTDGLGTAWNRSGLRNRAAVVRRTFADADRGRNVFAVQHLRRRFSSAG